MFNNAVSRSGQNRQTLTFSHINHVGLSVGNGYVIEATVNKGVIRRRLADFLNDAEDNLIATIKDYQLIGPAIARANHCLGLPYNASFHPEAEGLYCSQLITHVFKTTTGDNYFKTYPMNFIDQQTQQILPYWLDYYHQLKQDIPQGLTGSHPQQLLRQKHRYISIIRLE